MFFIFILNQNRIKHFFFAKGWNDVGFHGSNIVSTPNIDALAYHGIILNRFYGLPLCTPSRSALMSGKYPIHTGTQKLVILSSSPWGLGLDETILPQYLKSAGYKTHLVGKWHLGMFQKAYNPIQRGFDSFFGFLTGFIDYFKYTSESLLNPTWQSGYDMRKNEETYYDKNQTYATDLFTKESVQIIENHNENEPLLLVCSHAAPHAGDKIPLQAPEDEIEKFEYIPDMKMRVLAGIIFFFF